MPILPQALLPVCRRVLRSLPRGGQRLVPWMERCFDLEDVVTAQLVDGRAMRVRSRDVLQRRLFWFGSYERFTGELFRALLAPGATVLDLGANVGYFTLLAAAGVGPTGTVVAFEPVHENRELLAENVALNGCRNVRIEPCAVTDADGEVALFLHRKDVNSGMASLLGSAGGGVETRAVPGCSIDSYRRQRGLGRVHLVKMDIQGGEGKALDGMTRMLRDDAPALLWELNPDVLGRSGDSPRRLLGLLEAAGYRSFLLGERTLSPLTPAGAEELPDGSMIASWTDRPGEPPSLPVGWRVAG
jgi:FkbM family methyltransferase